jgi:hypothetical protein
MKIGIGQRPVMVLKQHQVSSVFALLFLFLFPILPNNSTSGARNDLPVKVWNWPVVSNRIEPI